MSESKNWTSSGRPAVSRPATRRAAGVIVGSILLSILPGTPPAAAATVPTERLSLTQESEEISGPSAQAALSGDGRFAAFVTAAPDVVANDQNESLDVFVRDRVNLSTARVSVALARSDEGLEDILPPFDGDGESREPAILWTGRFVAVAGPGDRRYHAMVFDSSRNRMVFFGDEPSGS